MERLPDSGASRLKAEFVRLYGGNGHIREALPNEESPLIHADGSDLEHLHGFARNNPIYHNSYEMDILGVPCTVYEGDINEYWIGSIKHDVSNQPFYPTWIISAYEAAREAARHGAIEVIDIGSGDGRVAYCASMLGLKAHGIEIDPDLSSLQRTIVERTGIGFNVWNADANLFDYEGLDLEMPAFFIGGLPEMGEMMARAILERVPARGRSGGKAVFVFMGSLQPRRFSRGSDRWGWGFVMDEAGLEVESAVVLPTCWTMDQERDTPYIFARRAA